MLKISSQTIATNTDVKSMSLKAVNQLQKYGFYQVANSDTSKVKTQITHLKKYKKLAVIGIGGSSLGPKVLSQVFDLGGQVVFFENVDPVSFQQKVQGLGSLEGVHWLVISKSGKTLETLAQLSLVLDLYGRQFDSANFTVVTDPGVNPLSEWAQSNQVRIVEMPENVGGRYSVLTPVGLLVAGYLNCDVDQFLVGARWANGQSELVAEAVAQTQQSFLRKEWITTFWSYSDSLALFGDWIQQLWAESLAKRTTRTEAVAPRMSTPLRLVGANDQHSILQQLMDGEKDKFIWFIGVNSTEGNDLSLGDKVIGLPNYLKNKPLGKILAAERIGTQKALAGQGVNSLCLEVEGLAEKQLGALFQFFALTVAGIAELNDINAFDQPGVELGKRLAHEILEKPNR